MLFLFKCPFSGVAAEKSLSPKVTFWEFLWQYFL